jgi:hypothetical protein
MATETLVAATDPLLISGSTAFIPGALTHTSRSLSLHVAGVLNAQKSGGHMYTDTAIVDYTVDGGGSWNLISNFTGEEGGLTLNDSFGPIEVSSAAPLANIRVRIRTTFQVPSDVPYPQVDTIELACSDAGVAPTDPFCHCDLFGF